MTSRRGTPADRRRWDSVREQLHDRGLRWTPQRRAVVDVLARTKGHITGSELIERCRARETKVVPSTVYRTLDLLEQLGLVRHGHGADGREEFHVGAAAEHGHLHCDRCGRHWEIDEPRASAVAEVFGGIGFAVDPSHVTIVGVCAECRTA